MNRYIYLLTYFNIVNSTLSQTNEKYAVNVREANLLIKDGKLTNSEQKTLLGAMGDFVTSLKMKGKFLISEDAINSGTKYNYGQKEFMEAMQEKQNYSFSFSTSFGKSFLARRVAQEMVGKGKRVLFIVPTLALMYEYFNALVKLNASTHNDDSLVCVLTQERALFYNYEENTLVIFDEAYEAHENQERSVLTSKIMIKATNAKSSVKMMSPNILDPIEILPKCIQKKFKPFVFNHTLTSRSIIKIEMSEKENFVKEIARDENDKWICYIAKNDTLELAENLRNHSKQNKPTSSINKSINDYLESEYSKDFLLVKLLNEGIAIHHGDIPKDIRYITELLFKTNSVKKIVANTTVLQGINLKANNLAIFGKATNGKFTDFMIRNLIGRVGRYSVRESTKFRHGKVYVVESLKFKFEKFEKINDKNLLAFTNSSNNENNKQIQKIKVEDADFTENAPSEKDILDYYFKSKTNITDWITQNSYLFSKDHKKEFFSIENLEKIIEICSLVTKELRTPPKRIDKFQKWDKKTEAYEKNTLNEEGLEQTIKNVIKNVNPYKYVTNILKKQISEIPEKIINKKSNLTFKQLSKNEIEYEKEVLKRLLNEISRRSIVTDVILTKLSIAVSKTLSFKNFDIEYRSNDVLLKMKKEGIPEVFYNSYENMNPNQKNEIKKLINKTSK